MRSSCDLTALRPACWPSPFGHTGRVTRCATNLTRAMRLFDQVASLAGNACNTHVYAAKGGARGRPSTRRIRCHGEGSDAGDEPREVFMNAWANEWVRRGKRGEGPSASSSLQGFPARGRGLLRWGPTGGRRMLPCCFPLASRAPAPPSMFTVRTLYSCTWVRTVPGYLGSAVLTVGADLMDLPRSIMHAA